MIWPMTGIFFILAQQDVGCGKGKKEGVGANGPLVLSVTAIAF